jgi:hypothetical protein
LDKFPVVLSRQGVKVVPAQKTDVVGVIQLVDAGGIAAELLIEAANRQAILLAAPDELIFLCSLYDDSSAGRCDRETNNQDGESEENRQEYVSSLASFASAASRYHHAAPWVSGIASR